MASSAGSIDPGLHAAAVLPPTVAGWAAAGPGARLERMQCPGPALGEHDVRVAVECCGLCYTDVHGIDDFFGITAFPFVPGHEIVGHVEARGSQVSELREGDRVGIGWQGRSCQRCAWCLRGEEQLCYDIGDCATWDPHGGLADSVTVDSRFAYPLPEAMPNETAAVLMCAGVAVYSPLRRFLAESNGSVGVYGVGGLGHLAIQLARALGYAVTAFSSSPSKADEALAFGAERFVEVGDRDRMRPFDGAFDLVLCTAHGAIDWSELLALLDRRGRIALVGFPDVSIQPTDLVAHELSIVGSLCGNRAMVREMLWFADGHRITPLVERMPMTEVNAAIERLKANRARYRIVLTRD